jgi:FMN phosphatase YigB (HAD superfamily)
MQNWLEKYSVDASEYTIFVDLDGVLVDFEKEWRETWEKDLGPPDSKKISKMPASWWANLPEMESGKELWSYIEKYNPYILTSSGGSLTEEQRDVLREGKREWVKRVLGLPKDRVIVRHDKYAEIRGPKSILIDDWNKNTSLWEKNGGIAILHNPKDAEATIDKLKELGL